MDQNREPKAQAGSSHNQQKQSKASNRRKFETGHKECQGANMSITFYYARQPEELLHLQPQCTTWLPEKMESAPNLWTGGQVIGTCDVSYLFRLRDQIQDGLVPAAKALWIEVRNKAATAYVFDASGRINNFFRVV